MQTIIGCGNSNRGDDGVGPYIAQQLSQRLSSYQLNDVQVFDAGTGGMDVMFKARGSRSLLIIDASSSGSEPGSVFELAETDLHISTDPVTNMHDFRWQHALYTGRQIFAESFPSDVKVILIEASELGLAVELSAPVQQAADQLIEQLFQRYVDGAQASQSRARISRDMALRMAEEADASAEEKAAMLAEVAAGLQRQAQSADDLLCGISLLRGAIALIDLPTETSATLQVQLAVALSQLPGESSEPFHEAYLLLENALGSLSQDEDRADAEMQQGLVVQALAASGAMDGRIAADYYQRALRVFDSVRHPAEYAIIHNNLATLWLSMPRDSGQHRLYESLAVQAFETALANIDAKQHPAEYAMLQNNLGNALQYSDSGEPLANKLRALDAYELALELRRDSPLLQANTLANRANCLRDLPDDISEPNSGEQANLQRAIADAKRAQQLFSSQGEIDKVQMMTELLIDLRAQREGATAGVS
jgi:hydrogenase maturation protease